MIFTHMAMFSFFDGAGGGTSPGTGNRHFRTLMGVGI